MKGALDVTAEWISQGNAHPCIKKLDSFLDNGKFQTPKSSEYTNIINQRRQGGHYFIPFETDRIFLADIAAIDYKDEQIERSPLDEHMAISSRVLSAGSNSYKTPIDEFFSILEECRLNGVVLGFCEQQYFTVPIKKKVLERVALEDAFTQEDLADMVEPADSDDIGNGGRPPVPIAQELTPEDQEADKIDKVKMDTSCIELDFDIFQKDPKRILGDTQYYNLIFNIVNVMMTHLEFRVENTSNYFTTHAVILRKPEVVEKNHKTYGKCWKDSMHIRFFIKTTKNYKKYLINTIKTSGILSHCMTGVELLNTDDVIDTQSPSYTVMCLGSLKNRSKVSHQFYKLYKIDIKTFGMPPLVTVIPDFDAIDTGEKAVKKKDPRDGRRNIMVQPIPKYKYNLCHELSVHYEATGGLIKKPELQPKPEIISFISARAERSEGGLVSEEEIQEVYNHVTDLTVRDYNAKYIQKILEILKPERVSSYENWKSIICILATENPDYKPLAIWFSHRCPQSWVRGGDTQLDGIWEWAVTHKPRADDSTVAGRKIETLNAWAKEDNPTEYHRLQEFNSFTKLQQEAMKFHGEINETQFADVLKVMYGHLFVVDENEHAGGRGSDRRWFEFVFPETQSVDSGMAYKWRWEKYPDSLDHYICKKLPERLNKLKEWIALRCEDSAEDEDAQKYYGTVKRNIEKSTASLGKASMIKNIVSRCEKIFRQRSFMESLDKDPSVIGVGNGVLKLCPGPTELIERWHEIRISRSTRVCYKKQKIDLNDPALSTEHPDPCIRHLLIEIQRLFCGETDAFIFTMCYLASSLDNHKRRPMFFLWLGEGSNGKSFLLELHIKTLHEVVRGGYAAKMNSAYFTKEIKASGTDSEKMMLKYARFAYCSESNEGDELQMGRIKEFTSETLSANEKYLTQDMFEANCQYVFCTNHDPRITGRDYGTWRRILVYYFKMKFIDHPDPENPFEYKCDLRLVQDVPYDVNYKQAYLSILVHFYELYRDTYGSDLERIPKPTINRETQMYKNEQDTIERFIAQQVVHIGTHYPPDHPKNKDLDKNNEAGLARVSDVSLPDLAARFIEWHKKQIGELNMAVKDIVKAFPQTRLRKYIVARFRDRYLTEHYVLNLGERYKEGENEEKKKDEKGKEGKEGKKGEKKEKKKDEKCQEGKKGEKKEKKKDEKCQEGKKGEKKEKKKDEKGKEKCKEGESEDREPEDREPEEYHREHDEGYEDDFEEQI